MDVFKSKATQCTCCIDSATSGPSSTDCLAFSNVQDSSYNISMDRGRPDLQVCAKCSDLSIPVAVAKAYLQDLQYTIIQDFSIQDGGSMCSYQL